MYGINSEPPKNCLDCPLCQGEYGRGNEKSYCAIKSEVKLKYNGSRPKECPIVTELDESVIQEVLNKRCMTIVANEYLVALHGKGPKGEWIFHKDFNENCRYGCNQCGNLNNIPSNFCPNCGAKMNKKEKKL